MERMENTRIQKANEEYQAKIVSDFQKNVEEAMKYNPEVVDAIQYIERYAEKINPNVRRALLTDDNAADLCYEIATNKDLLKLVIDGDPIDAVRAMTKWSTKFTRDSDKIIDHKNRNGLDNRRCNLRICTRTQNTQNTKISTRNSSGYKGISWCKKNGKWETRLYANKVKHFLGYYSNLNDAINIRLEAERKYYGEYSPNFEKD